MSSDDKREQEVNNQVNSSELKTNPRFRIGDITSNNRLIRFFKLLSKVKDEKSLYNEIIPRTSNHGSFILGAQLTDKYLEKFRAKEENSSGVVQVSMVTDVEFHGKNLQEGDQLKRLKWFDHGILNTKTGFNQDVDGMIEFQQDLAKQNIDKNIYCHCMAGKSRSFFETIAYLHVNSGQVFDFHENEQEWGKILTELEGSYVKKLILEKRNLDKKEQKELIRALSGDTPSNLRLQSELDKYKKLARKEVEELKIRLKDNPSVVDIAEFVRLRRPKTKPLNKLDGDQGSLLGLLALNQIASNLDYYKKKGTNEEEGKLREKKFRDAQSLKFMLSAPLDVAYRKPEDLKKQKENFLKVYKDFLEHDPAIDPLYAMICDNPNRQHDDYSDSYWVVKQAWKDLKPGEQAKLAILLQEILNAKDDIQFGNPFQSTDALAFARNAILKSKETKSKLKISAGDKVELLRYFGFSLFKKNDKEIFAKEFVEEIINDILAKKNGVSRHKAGLQLAELVKVLDNSEDLKQEIEVSEIVELIRTDKRITKDELKDFELNLPKSFQKIEDQVIKEKKVEQIKQSKAAVIKSEIKQVYSAAKELKDLFETSKISTIKTKMPSFLKRVLEKRRTTVDVRKENNENQDNDSFKIG